MGPLAGMKVIDLTHVMAGPTCTLMLADMGAEVIKIEKVPQGDDTRHTPPSIGDETAAFLMMNRNKRGMALDLKKTSGAKVLRRLLESADVLVENFGPGVMERLGFGYEDLHKKYPALIYCSLSGFGRTGPYKDRRGFDLVAQAMSGIMSFTGEGPGRPPVKCGAPLSDITAGILAAMGILAAYTHRLKTGEGQWVETSLYEAALVQTYWQSAIALATGVAPKAMGSAHPLNAPYQAFETADGWIVVGGANQKNWQRIAEAIGAPELVDDPRFLNSADRMEHLKELEVELAARFRKLPAAHWLTVLEQEGVPCGPVRDMLQALSDPQTIARDMVVEVPHAKLGRVQTLGVPIKFSQTPGKIRSGAPVYGEHSREILSEYGFGADEIAAFEKEGALVSAETKGQAAPDGVKQQTRTALA
jgi:crotonobetainyl-CoA:carnitine CoA-transferase CaiB-like acyl-CoA transferase